MERNDPRYQAYVEILKEELIPAMGCTEPIALAYAAAKAREVLGVLPDSVQLQVSGSIIKNVKSVIVPKYKGGVSWGQPFSDSLPKVLLTDAEYDAMIADLRAKLL